MKMNQMIMQRESDNIRKMSRLAIFDQKRFWLQEQEKQITQHIEEEFNKLKIDEPPQIELQNLRKFCKQFQTFDYYSGDNIDPKEYFIRILPIGQRCIVSSHQGTTTIKTISGQKYKFQSILPGGSSQDIYGKCILDCFLSANTIYIYDILQWNKTDMSEQVAQLRYFWIRSNILNQLNKQSEDCNYTFQWIPVIPSLSELQKTIFTYSKNGLLFIQKDSYYSSGVNPECFIYIDEATDDNYNEQLAKFRFDNTIIMTLGWHKNQLSTRDGIVIANHPSQQKGKSVVDVKIQLQDNTVVNVTEPTKHIEDPYSKLMFWKNQPRLRVQ